MTEQLKSLFPLPIPHKDRTSPLDFIPDCEDKYGQGERIWNIFKRLKVTQGAKSGMAFGDPGVSAPWQEKFIRSLFGHCYEDGKLFHTEALLYISKKQGKSSMGGTLAIAATLAFPTDRGIVVILASTQKQAGIVYDAMCGTIEADPFLLKQFQIRRYKNDILHRATSTRLSALPLEASALVGIIPSLAIVDELHVIGTLAKSKQLLEQVVSGQAVTPNPLTIYLTTAPLDKSSGVFSSMYARAKRIQSGKIGSDKLFPVMFELCDEDKEKDDPSTWWQSNPSLGYTFTKEWLIESFETARDDEDPTSLFNFYSQHLNIMAGEKFGISNWIPLEVWDEYANPSITLEIIMERSTTLYAGVDLGYRDDPSCVTVLGEIEIHGISHYYLVCRQYLHKDGYEKRKKQVEYDKFIEAGDLIVSEKENYDMNSILDIILKLKDTKKLAAVGVDPMGLSEFGVTLQNKKVEVIAIPQGYKLNPALIATERFLYEGRLHHTGSPMLRWNVSNGQLAERGQAMALVKPGDIHVGKKKIDGLVTLIMALSLANDPDVKPKNRDLKGMIG